MRLASCAACTLRTRHLMLGLRLDLVLVMLHLCRKRRGAERSTQPNHKLRKHVASTSKKLDLGGWGLPSTCHLSTVDRSISYVHAINVIAYLLQYAILYVSEHPMHPYLYILDPTSRHVTRLLHLLPLRPTNAPLIGRCPTCAGFPNGATANSQSNHLRFRRLRIKVKDLRIAFSIRVDGSSHLITEV